MKETGYMTGVIDQPYIRNNETTAPKLFFEVYAGMSKTSSMRIQHIAGTTYEH
jgi:hypothetical protein